MSRPSNSRYSAATGPRKPQPAIWNLISDLLQRNWSPEQVPAGTVSVSFSWLYQRIRQDRAQGGSLYTDLRQHGKASRSSAGRHCIPGRTDISERPAIVDSKQRSGDWGNGIDSACEASIEHPRNLRHS